MRESEERFRAMFQRANVGTVGMTLDGWMLMANPGFCKFIGYTEDETQRLTLRDISHPEDYEHEAAMLSRLIAGEIPSYSLEKRYVRKDGEIVWGVMTATPVQQPNGKPDFALVIVEDINKRKQAEAMLVRAHAGLEDKVRERTLELAEANLAQREQVNERIKAEESIKKLLKQLVTAQEDERRRIARDLHDHLGQQLTALNFTMETIRLA